MAPAEDAQIVSEICCRPALLTTEESELALRLPRPSTLPTVSRCPAWIVMPSADRRLAKAFPALLLPPATVMS